MVLFEVALSCAAVTEARLDVVDVGLDMKPEGIDEVGVGKKALVDLVGEGFSNCVCEF